MLGEGRGADRWMAFSRLPAMGSQRSYRYSNTPAVEVTS